MFWGRAGGGGWAGCRCCHCSFHRTRARSGSAKRGQADADGAAGCLPFTAISPAWLGAGQRGASPRLRSRPASPIPASRSRFNGEVTSIDVSSRHTVRSATFTYFKEIRVLKKKKKKQLPPFREETADSRSDRPYCGGS